MKFGIGDIITGVENSPYSITDSCGIYKVIRIYDDDFIRVKVLEHIDSSVIDFEFDVTSNHFIYAEGFARWDGIFNKAYNQKTFSVEDGVPVVKGVSVDSPCYKQLCEEYAKYKESIEKEK